MCNCISEIEERMKNHFLKEPEAGFKEVTDINFENSGFIFGEKTEFILTSSVVVSYTKATKKGNIQKKQKSYAMTHKFCPFCGEKKNIK